MRLRLAFAALIALLGATGCRSTTIPVSQPTAPAAEPRTLRWLTDGSLIQVDARWLLDPDSGQLTELPCPLSEGRRCWPEQWAFSLPLARAAFAQAQLLMIGDAAGRLTASEQLPRWLEGGSHASDAEVANSFAWLTPRILYVHQFYADGHAEPECRVREEPNAPWRKPGGGCLSSDFGYLAQIDVGPSGLLAVHSSAEGTYALRFARYDGAHAEQPVRAPHLVLQGGGSVQVQFSERRSRIELISPCVLVGAPLPPCEESPAAAWKLYVAPFETDTLQLLRDDLPAAATIDPLEERFAWQRGNAICVGDPNDASPRCIPL